MASALVIRKFRRDFLVGYEPHTCKILLLQGSGRNACGGSYSADWAMNFIGSHFTEEGGAWFLPFIKRMAAGETLDAEEIRREYKRIFQKEIIELAYTNHGAPPEDFWKTIEDQQ